MKSEASLVRVQRVTTDGWGPPACAAKQLNVKRPLGGISKLLVTSLVMHVLLSQPALTESVRHTEGLCLRHLMSKSLTPSMQETERLAGVSITEQSRPDQDAAKVPTAILKLVLWSTRSMSGL